MRVLMIVKEGWMIVTEGRMIVMEGWVVGRVREGERRRERIGREWGRRQKTRMGRRRRTGGGRMAAGNKRE